MVTSPPMPLALSSTSPSLLGGEGRGRNETTVTHSVGAIAPAFVVTAVPAHNYHLVSGGMLVVRSSFLLVVTILSTLTGSFFSVG